MTDRTVTSEAKLKRIPVDELMRLAFLWAEQDRMGFVEANHPGTPERATAEHQYQQLHAYRIKRWGPTQFETDMENATLVEIRSTRFLR